MTIVPDLGLAKKALSQGQFDLLLLDVDLPDMTVVLDPQAFPADGGLGLAGLAQRRAEAIEQSLARHLEQAQGRLARRRLQERAGLPAELDDLQIGIDGDLARLSLDEITRAERAWSELRAEATGACALSILSRVRMNSE